MTDGALLQRSLSGCKPRQHGLAMVEITIAAPLLLLLLYAIAELGNMFYQYALLADAARDADRYLATNAISTNTGVAIVSTSLVSQTQNLVVYGNTVGSGSPLLPGLAVAQVAVGTQTDATTGATELTVAVAYPYQSLFGGTLPDFVSRGTVNTALTLNVFTGMQAL